MSVTSRMAEGSFLVEARDMERLEDVVVVVVCEEATEDVEAECSVDDTEYSVEVDTGKTQYLQHCPYQEVLQLKQL